MRFVGIRHNGATVRAFKQPHGGQAVAPDLASIAQEIVNEEEFELLMQKAAGGERPKAYIGFEPSGTAHIGWMVCTQMIRELSRAGFDVTVLLADWHAQINDKLGGDLHNIRRCAEYMTDAFEALGVNKGDVTYRFAAEFAKDDSYWATVIQVAKHTTLARMRRAMTIMGRQEDEGDADVSKFLYPAMQVADIFHMDIDLACGGMDQRHAHMLARDVAKKMNKKAPVAFHTPLVPSLSAGAGRMDPAEAKMSKSNPDSGIFIHDEPDVLQKKISKAHCPAGEVDDNPVLDLLRLVIFPRLSGSFTIDRPEKFGGPLEFASYGETEAAFVAGTLHPMDLKNGVASALNAILAPVHRYFEQNPDNLSFMRGFTTTR
jgi:tyrosyl-tRNA synthetase